MSVLEDRRQLHKTLRDLELVDRESCAPVQAPVQASHVFSIADWSIVTCVSVVEVLPARASLLGRVPFHALGCSTAVRWPSGCNEAQHSRIIQERNGTATKFAAAPRPSF